VAHTIDVTGLAPEAVRTLEALVAILRENPANHEAPQPSREDWFESMKNARTKMEEAGCPFMDETQLQSHIASLREEDRIDELLQQAGPMRQERER
jgi:hypothetical protein